MGRPAGDRELVQIMDAAFADAARRAGESLACRPGCTQCCHGAFAINQLDALRLREGMEALRRSNPALAVEVERRAAEWVAEHGEGFPGDLETGVLGDSDAERERFEDYANDAACPALDPATGRCDLYEWRPMTCRVFGPPVRAQAPDGDGSALCHCELCFKGASTEQIANCEMTVPHELEEQLINDLSAKGETIVAFALLSHSHLSKTSNGAMP
jgi:Fe-S-cluster containining protein